MKKARENKDPEMRNNKDPQRRKAMEMKNTNREVNDSKDPR